MTANSTPANPLACIYVCRRCRPEGFEGEDDARPGAHFTRRVANRLRERELTDSIAIKAVDCLSVCKRPCTLAVTGADKFAYLIGDLDFEQDIDAVIDFAALHADSDDGITVWRERPEVVRKNTIARVPWFGCASSLVVDVEAELEETE